jgi:hypothetical protein
MAAKRVVIENMPFNSVFSEASICLNAIANNVVNYWAVTRISPATWWLGF